jgi:hypothetical protein
LKRRLKGQPGEAQDGEEFESPALIAPPESIEACYYDLVTVVGAFAF